MSTKIEVDVCDVRKVFDVIEKVHDLFHQPMKYKDTSKIEEFADENYSEIKELYYDVVWKWLPEDVKKEVENR